VLTLFHEFCEFFFGNARRPGAAAGASTLVTGAFGPDTKRPLAARDPRAAVERADHNYAWRRRRRPIIAPAARATNPSDVGSGTAVTPDSAAGEAEIPPAFEKGVPWMPMLLSMIV